MFETLTAVISQMTILFLLVTQRSRFVFSVVTVADTIADFCFRNAVAQVTLKPKTERCFR